LVQKRDKNKKTAPDKLDITAAGHLIAGESPTDGVREVEEELGIKINPNDLINLGIRVAVSESENKINKEFAHVFLMEHNLPIDQYQINKEVSGLVEIEVQDGLRLFSGATNRIFCNSVWLENGKKVSKIIEVRQEDFIYRIDQYYLKVFIMTERFYEGKSILAI
jgi:isopentenyldiphosphate isomerase